MPSSANSGRGRDRILAALADVRHVEGHAHHVRSDRLDQPHNLPGRDLLVGLHIHVDAQIAGDRRELVQEPLGRLKLLLPGHIGPEAVVGEMAPVVALVVGRPDPDLADLGGGAGLQHPPEPEQDVAVAGRSQLRRLGRGVRVDLAEPTLDVHPQAVRVSPDLAQLALVEGRAHLQHGPEEQPLQPEAPGVVEAPERAVLRRPWDLATVYSYAQRTPPRRRIGAGCGPHVGP
jgi:hypothetical protein